MCLYEVLLKDLQSRFETGSGGGGGRRGRGDDGSDLLAFLGNENTIPVFLRFAFLGFIFLLL